MSITSLLKSIVANGDQPVTFGMHRWHEEGATYTQEAFDRVVAVITADRETGRGGDGRIRPSLIGHPCQRAHLLSYRGVEQETPGSASRDVMTAGTWGHYRWQYAGLSAGWLKEIEVKVQYEPWHLAGSMDGILSDGSGFELKTINSFGYKKVLNDNQPKWEHLMQVHAYMKALDLDAFSVVYENRDTAAWREFRVKRMPEVDTTLDMLMHALDGHIKNNTFPPMLTDCLDGKGSIYERCNWRFTCPLQKEGN